VPVAAPETVLQQDDMQCKVEHDLNALCLEASNSDQPFGETIHNHGLIEIDSSSGSESTSDSSEDEDSSSEHFANAMPAPVFSETVPEGFAFYVHKKSKIMHRAKLHAVTTVCKITLNAKYTETERTFHFRFPKCMRCFTKDHNRLKTVVDVVRVMDESAKRRKA
jgi:hypothetical protein